MRRGARALLRGLFAKTSRRVCRDFARQRRSMPHGQSANLCWWADRVARQRSLRSACRRCHGKPQAVSNASSGSGRSAAWGVFAPGARRRRIAVTVPAAQAATAVVAVITTAAMCQPRAE